MKLKTKVKQIFGSVEEYVEDIQRDSVRFIITAGEIDFSKLKTLSELLETKKIHLHGEGCGCDCRECNYFSDSQRIVIEANEVRYRPLGA